MKELMENFIFCVKHLKEIEGEVEWKETLPKI